MPCASGAEDPIPCPYARGIGPRARALPSRPSGGAVAHSAPLVEGLLLGGVSGPEGPEAQAAVTVAPRLLAARGMTDDEPSCQGWDRSQARQPDAPRQGAEARREFLLVRPHEVLMILVIKPPGAACSIFASAVG